MDTYDKLKIGDLVTSDYLEIKFSNSQVPLIEKESVGKLYETKLRTDLNSNSENVRKANGEDTSSVYEIVQKYFQDVSEVITEAQEPITHGLKAINTDHGAIHLGFGFCASLYLASLAGSAIQRWRIKGPTTKYAHLKSIQVSAEGSSLSVKLIKDVTIVNSGTEVAGAINNLNHNSTILPTTKIYDSGTTYTGGNTWCQVIIHGDTSGVGTGIGSNGGNFVQSDYLEYITKTGDEDYVLEIQNLKTDVASNISVQLFFYEESQGLVVNGN